MGVNLSCSCTHEEPIEVSLMKEEIAIEAPTTEGGTGSYTQEIVES